MKLRNMSSFSIPNNGQIRQINNSDTFGELNETYNVDLTTKLGKIKTSKKLIKVLDGVDDLESESGVALAIYKSKYYLVTTGDTWSCSVINDPTNGANWLKETAIAIGEDFESDAVVFADLLLISTSTDIASWNNTSDVSNWWTSTVSGTALTDAYPHTMHVHRGGAETLFVTDKNKVRYYNTSAGHSTVTLQTDLVANCIASGVNAIWVGTYTENSTNAYVYEIYIGETSENGTPIARNAYKVEGRAVLSIDVIDNIPYIVTEKGNVQAFNGAGFTTVASFPFVNTVEKLGGVRAGQVQDSNIARPVHPKGMQSHNDSLYININTEKDSGDYPERTPSGIWEYNKTTGQLTHRYAFAESTSDFGAKENENSGPLLITDTNETLLLAGAGTRGNNDGLYAESSSSPMSYFVTTEIESDTVADAFESVYLKAKTLSGSDSIELKYRATKVDKVFANVAIASNNIINTTDDLSNISPDSDGVYNWEVTISETGIIAQVENITKSSGTYTVTLDRTIGTPGQTVRASFENWAKDAEVYQSSDGEYKRFGGYDTNPWIQFKVVMYGDVELRQFLSKGNSKHEL